MIYLSPARNLNDIGQHEAMGAMLSYGSNSCGVGHLSKTTWAADNGCFKRPDLNTGEYLKWLASLCPYLSTCLFAVAPDVVGDARETWARSEPVLPLIRALGFRAALVAQDGIEDRPIRWGSFDVLFIGGTTEWKLSEAAYEVARQAKEHGCHVHMGRVNSRRRLRIAYLAGCDSADGTHLVFKPDERLGQLRRWLGEMKAQPFLQGLDRAA
jgi:hypothetical protein